MNFMIEQPIADSALKSDLQVTPLKACLPQLPHHTYSLYTVFELSTVVYSMASLQNPPKLIPTG